MKNRKLAIVAVGGNSLVKDERRKSHRHQYMVVKETSRHIADMIEAGWEMAIGHGNGPQLGFTLRRSEVAYRAEGVPAQPMDIGLALTQAEVGYALQQNLQNELFKRGIQKRVATVLSQTLVDEDDPAYRLPPTKPVGSFMSEEEAKQLAAQWGWNVAEDAGRGWRRMVSSPFPKKILEIDTIRTLVDAGIVTITAGGGGIPVIDEGDGQYTGVPGAVDKDYAASLLAQELKADLFVVSTAVEKVAINFGQNNQTWFDKMTLSEAKKYLAEGVHFARGSMAPKVHAIVWYLENGGKEAVITNPENIGNALNRKTGTWFVHDNAKTFAAAGAGTSKNHTAQMDTRVY
ncbi:MAG TPA: carbamate kinase [Anaerolineales bacterium]|nr:carbamate kinase [Anaerolineales bacterium]